MRLLPDKFYQQNFLVLKGVGNINYCHYREFSAKNALNTSKQFLWLIKQCQSCQLIIGFSLFSMFRLNLNSLEVSQIILGPKNQFT